MTPPMQVARPPRRFRTRLLVVLVGTGALALLAAGLAGAAVIDKFLAISLEPVASVLDRVDRHLEATGDPPIARDVQQAQRYLVQAELARRSLTRLAPLAFLAVLATALIALAMVAVRMSRRLSVPIERLTTGMLRYANGDLSHRVPHDPSRAGDELEFLLGQFNQMGAQLCAQRERLQVTEELAAWQGVARALAHELRNPLTAMKMAVARAARALDRAPLAPDADRPVRESMELLDQEMDALIRMTKSFSAFARLPRPQVRPLDLATAIEDVAALYRESSPVAIELSCAAPLPVRGDADQLRRALGNLVKNAIEASVDTDGDADGGADDAEPAAPIRVTAERAGDQVIVVIADRGKGIDAPRAGSELTRSLGTTKPGGSGLGLPIAHKIIHDHDGSLRLEPGESGGCRAIVTLPVRVDDDGDDERHAARATRTSDAEQAASPADTAAEEQP